MKRFCFPIAFFVVLSVCAGEATALPRVFAWSPEGLARVKAKLAAGDPALKPALDHLKRDADKALRAKPESVVNKAETPPSGDKHDYMSLAPYSWPNPDKPDGLPYINKDGQVNPESKLIPDHTAMGHMHSAVETLALAYYFTGNEAYAAHAAELLRAWFLDPATRMNPNLNYAQAVKGRDDGRGTGIIDTTGLIRLVDAAGLLAGAKAWTVKDETELRGWFGAFAKWLTTSKNGKDEAKASNNHGVWYDAQLAAYALFAGDTELARKTLEDAKLKRVDAQIKPDGAMPRELARTKSWSYTIFNLEAFFTLMALGERVGVDLASYQGPGGGSIRKAFEYILPYADPEKKWPTQQIADVKMYASGPLMQNAAQIFGDPRYDEIRAKLKLNDNDARYRLLPARALK